jgi:tRNA pseudouridine32 synthase/23S rRNA pseudouridine746 synthase
MTFDIASRLLHRDGLMIVLDKPAGIAVHRGPKGGECLEDHFDALRFGLPRAPALAHRLDRDTAGCLILGRHRKALERLGALFKQGRIGKTYWALVEGWPEAEQGSIDLPLARLDLARGWWMKVDPLGLPSRTRWRVLGRCEDPARGRIAWLQFEPLTGRTHQIRVHAAAMGWPVLADPVYGSGPGPEGVRLCLLARRVSVPLQQSKAPVVVTALPPPHMTARLCACGWVDQEEPRPDHDPSTG